MTSTAEPAFACDSERRIVAWNRGAEQLLGHAACDVLGKLCFEVLEGTDIFGNRFCDEHCPIRSMVQRHEPVHHCQLSFRTASAERILATVAVFVLAERPVSDYSIVHVMEAAIGRPEETDPSASSDPPAETRSSCLPLTARETEVLRLLAGGMSTSAIASRLSISEATVRNHVHHILNKLNARSRLEAVCLAIRDRLF